MNVVLLSIALISPLGSPMVIPVGDRVPVVDVQRSCKEAATTNKAVDLDLSQSVANCLRDEDAARLQLIGTWSTYSTSVRDRFEQEATILPGSASYVEMLTCLQLAGPATSSPTTGLSGASETRNKN